MPLASRSARLLLAAVLHFTASQLTLAIWNGAGLTLPRVPGPLPAEPTLLHHGVGSLLMALLLAPMAEGLVGPRQARFAWLALFAWGIQGPVNALEVHVFSHLGGTPFLILMPLLPALAAARALTPPAGAGEPTLSMAASPLGLGAWRWVLAWLAFPVAYFLVGALIFPFVEAAYREGLGGLTLPPVGTVANVVGVRGLMLLVLTLPLLRMWGQGRGRLAVALGLAYFVTVGLYPLTIGVFLPLSLRLIHGGEILADSLIHAGALVLLLTRKA